MRGLRRRLFCFIALVSLASIAMAEKPGHPAVSPAGVSAAPTSGPRLTRQERIDAINAHFRETHNGASPEEFGIQCCQITQIPISAFTNFSNGEVWEAEPFLFGFKYPVAFGTQLFSLWAPVQLPSGVVIAFVDLYYYDIDAANDIGVELWAYPGAVGPPPAPFMIASAYSSFSPGFAYQNSTVFAHTVDNDVLGTGSQLNAVIYVVGGAPNANLGFKSVDLWWYRQVSPAPAVAFFNDVPTSDFGFQFVEAFAAAGITVGCTSNPPFPPPVYCPDRNVTRREMAIFFAKALGLHWPL
jgi:hypothetical protein